MIDAQEALRQISVLMVFVEGLLSFLSPCVLPLLPIYMGYLAGSNTPEEKRPKRQIIFFTLSFILGIFTAIFLMNLSIGFISTFFKDHMVLFTRIGGILIILLGLFQIGFFKSNMLGKTKRFQFKMNKKMNIFFAFLMGFTFSFAWTPCIGPALSSILILASSSQDFWMSNFLMVVYALGLTIPFLLVGIFTDLIMGWLAAHKNIMKYTVKIGAIILIIFGVMMFSGKMNAISNYMSGVSTLPSEKKQETATPNIDQKSEQKEKSTENEEMEAALKQLRSHKVKDQHGKEVTLGDYKGKVVFLNFWATWCPPCRGELPHVQDLYEKYKDSDDVAVLTIVYPGGQEKDVEGLKEYIDENKLTMPVLMDDGFFYSSFEITSMPTTFMLDRKGNPYGYVQGALTSDMMESMISKTKNNE